MGLIQAEDVYLTCIKYEKRGGELMYASTEKEFFLLAGDCRIIFEKHSRMERARASRRAGAAAVAKAQVLVMDGGEMEQLKNRVYIRASVR